MKPYNSWGNGSAMRVSPVGWAFDNIDTVLQEAARSAEISHIHPEGIKGHKLPPWRSFWPGRHGIRMFMRNAG